MGCRATHYEAPRGQKSSLERLTIPLLSRGLGMEIAGESSQITSEESIMAKPLLPDELWEIIEPVLPKWTPSPKGDNRGSTIARC